VDGSVTNDSVVDRTDEVNVSRKIWYSRWKRSFKNIYFTFTTQQLQAFTPEQIQMFTRKQIHWFSKEHFAAFILTQLQAFTPEQHTAFTLQLELKQIETNKSFSRSLWLYALSGISLVVTVGGFLTFISSKFKRTSKTLQPLKINQEEKINVMKLSDLQPLVTEVSNGNQHEFNQKEEINVMKLSDLQPLVTEVSNGNQHEFNQKEEINTIKLPELQSLLENEHFIKQSI